MYDNFLRYSVLQIIYFKNYYYEQFAKISTCVKYLIDAYHRYILPRYISSFRFGNFNSCDYHGQCLNLMFPLFHKCFLSFPLFPVLNFALLQCYPVFCRYCCKNRIGKHKLGRKWKAKIMIIHFLTIFFPHFYLF